MCLEVDLLRLGLSLQLNIHKPVRDIIDSMCGTFNICNPNEFHLWIPAGIQSIIEKYGGRPVSLLLFIVVMLFIIVFCYFQYRMFYLQKLTCCLFLLQKSRVGRFKRRSSSFIGDFGMSDQSRGE